METEMAGILVRKQWQILIRISNGWIMSIIFSQNIFVPYCLTTNAKSTNLFITLAQRVFLIIGHHKCILSSIPDIFPMRNHDFRTIMMRFGRVREFAYYFEWFEYCMFLLNMWSVWVMWVLEVPHWNRIHDSKVLESSGTFRHLGWARTLLPESIIDSENRFFGEIDSENRFLD